MSIIYGSPLFLSSSSQNADLPPLLDNFKAYIGTTPPEPETITLADIPVSDAETETIVNLKENDGQLHPYIYLSNNYENSKAGLLLRKDIYQIGTIDNTSGNKYQNNSLDNWCVTTFVSYLDTIVKDLLVEVDIPSTSGTKIRRNCFALSVSEYGGNQLSEGNAIPYFNSNSKRVSMYESNSRDYWTRSSYADVGSTAYFIKSTGEISSNISAQKGYRPAICLNLSLTLKTIPNEDGSYDMYEGQAVQTLAETDGIITIAADKMEESRANELAGAVWVYGDHIPKNVNDGTKIQLTREEIIRPDTDPYITLADIPVSDADTETIVNLKESDKKLHSYILLNGNYELSGGCLLLRKDIISMGKYRDDLNTSYTDSIVDIFCTTTFYNTLDERVQRALIDANIQIERNLSKISRKAFLLSTTEMQNGAAGSGTYIPYFSNDDRRIATLNQSPLEYFTRDYARKNSTIHTINESGKISTNSPNNSLGYRPAIVISPEFKLKIAPNEDGSYDMYDETSSVSTYASSEFTVEKQVSWEKTKDFYARQFTYNSKKQYQTMIEGAVANVIVEGTPANVTDFQITGSDASPVLTWKNPVDDELYQETVVIQKQDSEPTDITDGTEIYRGTDETCTATGLEQSTDYYFGIYTVSSLGAYKQPVVSDVYRYDFPAEPDRYEKFYELTDKKGRQITELEYQLDIPETGWYAIYAFGEGGNGGGISWTTGTHTKTIYLGGTGATGGYGVSTGIKMYQGDSLKVVFKKYGIDNFILGMSIYLNDNLIGFISGENVSADRGENSVSSFESVAGTLATVTNFTDTNNPGIAGKQKRSVSHTIGQSGSYENVGPSRVVSDSISDISYTMTGGNSERAYFNTSSVDPSTDYSKTWGSPAAVYVLRGNTNTPSVAQASMLSLIPSDGELVVDWTNSGDPVQTGTMLVYNTNHVPTSANDGVSVDIPAAQAAAATFAVDGEQQEENKKQSYTITGLSNDKPVYVALFPYDANKKYGIPKTDVEIPRVHSWYDTQQELQAEVATVKAEMADYQEYYITTQEVLK